METLLSILNKTTEYFSKYGVENPKLDAELLIAHVLDCNRMQLYLSFERPMEEDVLSKLRPMMKRRAAREPLQYILGVESFFDFELRVDKRALIPRPETEELLELIFRETNAMNPKRIIDLGTGTGAIACALARQFRDAHVTATDISKDTLSLAQENIEGLGLSDRIILIQSDWFLSVEGTFDLIVSNPPYLSDAELIEIEPEVANHEPIGALTSGETGLEDIESLLRAAKERLADNGRMYLEVGAEQRVMILRLSEEIGGLNCEVLADLNQKDRFVRVTLQ